MLGSHTLVFTVVGCIRYMIAHQLPDRYANREPIAIEEFAIYNLGE